MGQFGIAKTLELSSQGEKFQNTLASFTGLSILLKWRIKRERTTWSQHASSWRTLGHKGTEIDWRRVE